MNTQPITEAEWKGLTLDQGINKAQSIGYIYRIVEENGNSLMLEYTVKSNRVNFRLRNNIIIGVFTG